MKKIIVNRLSLRILLIVSLFSSTAFLTMPFIKTLWREITEAQAKKQSLNIPSWAPLVERAQPAVLVITTEAVVEQPMMEFPGLPFYLPMPPERQQGKGSGFIINEDGYFITNEHVIHGAQKIKVRVGLSRREYNAKIIGADEALDIALGQIEHVDSDPKKKIKWPFLPMGDSDKLKLGDAVIALGNPMGLDQSVNVGIVSQKHRGGIKPNGRDIFVGMIQLQMPINPGNSGGPILDDAGRVVAVSESIMAAGNAIAFGVPINIVKEMLPFLEKGAIEKSYLGIDPMDLTPDLAKKLGLSEDEEGAVIARVHPNAPAQKAGLHIMDVVLEIDGIKVSDSFKLREKTAYKGTGQVITLKVYRQERGTFEIKVKLEKRPDQRTQYSRPQNEKSRVLKVESLGLELSDTSEQLRHELSLSPPNLGAQVLAVANRSVAESANILPGDVIVKVDRVFINNAEKLKDIFDKAPAGSIVPIWLWRGQDMRFVYVTMPDASHKKLKSKH